MNEGLSLHFLLIVYRNYLVWRKLLVPSLLGNLADPLIWLLGFGLGFGAFLPEIGGVPFLAFLAAGMICYSTMYSASFEALYSGYARLAIQRTWESILHAPLTVGDVVLGEWTWAALKSVLSGAAILLVMYALGLTSGWKPLLVLPVCLMTGLAFAGVALVITALAKSYDFFIYYFTLVITPMMLLSGVFFPVSGLPETARRIAELLPLLHATELARALTLGSAAPRPLANLAVLGGYALVGMTAAGWLMRRRLMK